MTDKQTEGKPNRDAQGQFLPGPGTAGPGRPRGSRNATTMTIKDGITEAYHQLGGIQWLVRLGQEEPRIFASLLLRLVPPTPSESAEEGGGDILDDPDPDL